MNIYLIFLLGYPILQLWTLVKCQGWWRASALFCLIPTGPFYAWSAMDYLGYFGRESLGSLIVMCIGPFPMLYLATVAAGYEAAEKGRAVASKREIELDDGSPTDLKPSIMGTIGCLIGGTMLALQLGVFAAVAAGELATRGSVSAFTVPVRIYLIGLPLGLIAWIMGLARRGRYPWRAGLGLALILAGPILFAASIAAGFARF